LFGRAAYHSRSKASTQHRLRPAAPTPSRSQRRCDVTPCREAAPPIRALADKCSLPRYDTASGWCRCLWLDCDCTSTAKLQLHASILVVRATYSTQFAQHADYRRSHARCPYINAVQNMIAAISYLVLALGLGDTWVRNRRDLCCGPASQHQS
jgi:hypothetical protein